MAGANNQVAANFFQIILMSATLNASAFGDYFKFKVPIIDIPGRTFPVQQYYLEEILEVINFSIDECFISLIVDFQ